MPSTIPQIIDDMFATLERLRDEAQKTPLPTSPGTKPGTPEGRLIASLRSDTDELYLRF